MHKIFVMSGKSGITWGSIALMAIVAIIVDGMITNLINFISSNIWTIAVIALIILLLFYTFFINEDSPQPPSNEPPTDYF